MLTMTFEFSANSLSEISAEAIIVFAFQNEKSKAQKYQPLSDFLALDKQLKGLIGKSATVSKFSAKRGETLNVFPPAGTLALWIVVVGLGKKNEFVANDLRLALGRFAGKMHKKIASVALSLPAKADILLSSSMAAQLIGEGLILGSYEFNKYQAKDSGGRKNYRRLYFQKPVLRR